MKKRRLGSGFNPPRRLGESAELGAERVSEKVQGVSSCRDSGLASSDSEKRKHGLFMPPTKSRARFPEIKSDLAAAIASKRQIYEVLHTKRSNKKRKIWDDGVLVVVKNKAHLFDMDGKEIGKTSYRSNEELIPDGSTLEVGGKLLEVGKPLNADDFDSGRLFLSVQVVVSKASVPASTKSAARTLSKPFQKVTGSSSSSKSKLIPGKLQGQEMFPSGEPDAVVLKESNSTDSTAATVVDPKLGKLLRPHQKEGVKFLFDCVTNKGKDRPGKEQPGNRGAILADEMGLGKTLQTITLVWTLLKQGPFGKNGPTWCKKAVVVTPSSLVKNWDAEFRKWLGMERIKPLVASGSGEAVQEVVREFSQTKVRRILLVSYEMFRRYADLINAIPKVDLIVCDEGHRLKSSAGNQTIRALDATRTKRRIILTGTPVQNDLGEFFAMVNFVNPQALGSDIKSFQRIFQKPIERGTDKSASETEKMLAEARSAELRKLTSSFILRRTAAVNKDFLPKRTDINVFVRLTSDQIVAYKSYVAQHLFVGSTIGTNGTQALKLIHYLRQLCTHPNLVSTTVESREKENAVPDVAASGKLSLLAKFLKEIRDGDPFDRIVLVSNSTKTLELVALMIKTQGWGFLRLDGATPPGERQRLVDRFNMPVKRMQFQTHSSSFPFAFLLSAKAGGCGLNLIGANRLILLDLDWNPATDQQAAARIWRDGQSKPVFIYRFIATGTIEERIFQRQELKISNAQGVLRESNRAVKTVKSAKFSRVELRQLFEYAQGTRCNTYDLMIQQKGSGGSTEIWEAYAGPESIPDKPMRVTASRVGPDVVTWVQSQEFNAVSKIDESNAKEMPGLELESDLTGENEFSDKPEWADVLEEDEEAPEPSKRTLEKRWKCPVIEDTDEEKDHDDEDIRHRLSPNNPKWLEEDDDELGPEF